MRPVIAAAFALGVALCDAAESVTIGVDATKTGNALPNPAAVLTVWDGRKFVSRDRADDYPIAPFVEYVEMMAATGGNKDRDMDNGDFSPLIAACREVLKFGAKPYLKLGNVPKAFTEGENRGEFSINIRPPKDHLVHYRYMRDCASALKAAFGRDEMRKWRYAVLTEADNAGWFRTKSGDIAETREEFFKLYDYATKAWTEELGDGIVIGTHLLNPRDTSPGSPCRSAFSLDDVINHCLCETNRATGKIGAPLRLLTISAYSIPDTDNPKAGKGYAIDKVTKALSARGLENVVTGIDEGRVIVCMDGGREKKDLITRVVGHSYQAAYDVRITKELFDAGADYFAAWGFKSGSCNYYEGLPSFSYFTALETSKFKGMRRVEASVSGTPPEKEEIDAVAALSADGGTLRVMVSRFRDLLVFDKGGRATLKVKAPRFAGKALAVETLTLDDRNNWFTDWYANRSKDGIGPKDFHWSGADPAVTHGRALVREEHRKLFIEKYMPRYRKIVETIRPVKRTVPSGETKDGVIAIDLDFKGNAAVFVSIAEKK